MVQLNLNILSGFFKKKGYKAEIQQETQQIYFSLHAEKREFPLFVRIFEEGRLLQLLVFIPCPLTSHTVADMGRLLHMFNKELDIPGFGMDEASAVIFFRSMIPATKGQVEDTIIDSFLGTMQTVCQAFAPAIEAVASGAISFEEMLKKAKELQQHAEKQPPKEREKHG